MREVYRARRAFRNAQSAEIMRPRSNPKKRRADLLSPAIVERPNSEALDLRVKARAEFS
jgi:hypothetical protein